MKAAAPIEPWNQSAEAEADALDEPRNFFLLAEIEVQALLAGVIPTKVVQRLKMLDREVLEVPR